MWDSTRTKDALPVAQTQVHFISPSLSSLISRRYPFSLDISLLTHFLNYILYTGFRVFNVDPFREGTHSRTHSISLDSETSVLMSYHYSHYLDSLDLYRFFFFFNSTSLFSNLTQLPSGMEVVLEWWNRNS
jgi:hypothetical protein